jgi:hypothetical protein
MRQHEKSQEGYLLAAELNTAAINEVPHSRKLSREKIFQSHQ